MNAQPKTCNLRCSWCAKNTTQPIANIAAFCAIKGNCKNSKPYRYEINKEVYNFNGDLMNKEDAETAKAIQDVAIKRALEAAAPAQPDATQTQTQTVAVAQPAQAQAVAVAQPAQSQIVAVAQPAQSQAVAVAQPAQPAQPAQAVAVAQPAQAQTVAAQPAQSVAAQPTIQDLQQQLILLQQQITQATATGNTTTVASTAEQFKNNYGSYSYSYSPFKYEYAKF
jgi:hypothetical protein